MKSVYTDPDTGSTALLSKYRGRIYTIDSLVTPDGQFGKGGARRVMTRIIEDADKQNVTLRLLIAPLGPMRYDELKAWYQRLGFREWAILTLVRLPKVDNETMPAQTAEGLDRTRRLQLGQVFGLRQDWPKEA